MSRVAVQIRKWLMQPMVWRFVGVASSVIGLLCYSLSSSFNYLFGKWIWWKIFLYGIFSMIISLALLVAKKWQRPTSRWHKVHLAFLVLTITCVYSFFFDKVVKGKPDAYSLISSTSFAIMSLSLSIQTHCGVEVDLLYFFCTILTAQLMKIKLLLGIVGAGFSYSLVILRPRLDGLADPVLPVQDTQLNPFILNRYESQKRRDWNTFLQYLSNHKPPLTLAQCSGAHVIEFLKYLDQFGKTKVHIAGCPYFGHPNPPSPCACPLKQAWGSLNALIGRLRLAFELKSGRPHSNPFGARAVRFYLREVREGQAKARGIPYKKKKRKRATLTPRN